MRRVGTVLTCLLLLFAGCHESLPQHLQPQGAATHNPASESELQPTKLSCVLAGKTIYGFGEAPEFTVTLRNSSDHDFYLVGELDGSTNRLRYPHCAFQVSGPDGKSVVFTELKQCGNTGPLRVQDFVKVSAGATFDPFRPGKPQETNFSIRFFSLAFLEPGEYRVQFIYATNCDYLEAWRGSDCHSEFEDPAIVDLWQQVPKLEVRSNELVFTINAPL